MKREIEYLKNYVALQKLRLPVLPGIDIIVNLDTAGSTAMIAPMLLIPFVENAFKHGIRLQEKSWVHIALDCADGRIRLKVINSTHPPLANDPEQGRSGIGLQNVHERLVQAYPGRHHLKYGVEGDAFSVNLTIQTN